MRNLLCALALLLGGVLTAAHADVAPSPLGTYTQYQQDLMKAGTLGPASIPLKDQAVLSLPEGTVFLPQGPAKTVMQRMGNATDANFLGLVLPWQESDWFITLEFVPSGYVADDDAKSWKADDLLASIRENTNKENVERKKQGVPGLDILGWVEKPHYDNANHRLIWSILAKPIGAQAGSANIINYKMLALGRQGYVSLVMVTDASVIQARKPIAVAMLSHVKFDGGKGYGDFNASTDRVAEYGLAALIGGVVVKKLGLLAIIAAFFVKGAKFLVVLAAGGLAALRRFFRRGKPAESAASSGPDMRLAPPPSEPPS
ncbi:MAG TPA: DUF2167 domain-containing protein [Rhizomicrobium sp.]|nr:DUF2167 domain-containing protein [Rhizomicrobium sp.]